MDIKIHSATQEYRDEEIRRLMNENPMDGDISIVFLREPSFFNAACVEGRYVEIYAAIDSAKDKVVGAGSRSIKQCYINGEAEPVGYLSGLRIAKQYRNGAILFQGYRHFKERHGDNRAKLYLSTIVEGNLSARKILESGREGLPAYVDIGRFCTLAIGLKGQRRLSQSGSYNVRRAMQEDIPEIVSFLNQEGRAKQFFPKYTEDDFALKQSILRGLKTGDIFLVFDNQTLVGTTAVWDQRGFRQSKVIGYKKSMGIFRPFINLASGLFGYPKLPKPGTICDCFSLALICVKNNSAEIFQCLIEAIMKEYRDKYSFFLCGLHEKDPLLKTITQYRNIPYYSRVYVVFWSDGREEYDKLDGRIPYLELGAL